jgi:hypothetical protein
MQRHFSWSVEAKMNSIRDICDLMQARTSSGRAAFEIIKITVAKVIAALRRDPRFCTITSFELELLLADVHRDTGNMLFEAMHNRIHIDDAEDAVRRCLGEN